MTTSEVRIKLTFAGKGTFRRDADPATFSWTDFRKWALERFPEAANVRNLQISYEDEDGDKICLVTEEDFREAVTSHVKAGRPLRILMEAMPNDMEVTTTASSASASSSGGAAVAVTAVNIDLEQLTREIDLEEEAAAAAAAAGVTDTPPFQQHQQPGTPQRGPAPPHAPPPPTQAPGGGPVPVDEVLRQVLGGLRGTRQLQTAIGRTRAHVLPLVNLFTPPAVANGVNAIVGDAFDTAERIIGCCANDHAHDEAAHHQQQTQEREECHVSGKEADKTDGDEQGKAASSNDQGAGAAPPTPPPPHHHHHHHHRHHDHHHRWGMRHGGGHHHGRGRFHPVPPTTGAFSAPPPPHPHQPPAPTEEGGGAGTPAGEVRHWGVTCDKCGAKDIFGVRYKCSVRRDYDVCEHCVVSDDSPYPYLKIKDPQQAPCAIIVVLPAEDQIDYSNDANQVHIGIVCDGCGMSPIVGSRYRCTRRPNWDLCSECEKTDTTGYPLLHIRLPSQAPAHLHVTGPQGKTCRWMSRGANRHAWREHRDRYRELARAREQQHQHQQAASMPVADAVMTEVVMPTTATAEASVPMPLTEQQSEDMLEEALRLSLQEVTIEGGGAVPRSMETGGGGGASKVAKMHDDDDARSAVSRTSSTSSSSTTTTTSVEQKQQKMWNAKFVGDATFPDGTVVQPRVELHKTWVLANSGTHAFPDDTRLVFAYGHLMEGPAEGVHVGAIEPGQDFSVTIPLVAPAENSRFLSCWNLVTRANGEPTIIGSRIWIDVTVRSVDEDGWCWVGGEQQQQPQPGEDVGGAAVPSPAAHEATAQENSEATPMAEENRADHADEASVTTAATTAPLPVEERIREVSAKTNDTAAEPKEDEVATPMQVEEGGAAAPSITAVVTTTTEEAAPAVTREYSRWAEQLQLLNEMGLTDTDRAYDVLEENFHSQGLEAVIEALLIAQ